MTVGSLRVTYCGNFAAPHSTETHVARALRNNGHHVRQFQENDAEAWKLLGSERWVGMADVVLWTRTGWSPPIPHEAQCDMLETARRLGVPVVGVHLDRWHGLDREGQVYEEPFFDVDLLCTADGGHDEAWRAAGVDHAWFPPAVSRDECEPGQRRQEYVSDVAFVGSWRPGYHAEWPHRAELVEVLRKTYRNRVKFWPPAGRPAIRGTALRDLYASARVLVGDSCLAGGAVRYCSDRIPETIGRGGFLVHPHVEGVTDGTLYTDGEHLRTWPLGDWRALRETIDHYLARASERQEIAAKGKAHVLANHTYEARMAQLVDLLRQRGMVAA